MGKVASFSQRTRCYVALGSNLGCRKQTMLRALEMLRQTRGIQVLNMSTLQETRPLGSMDQPDYLNAVVSIETTLKPLELLDQLQATEARLGRVRTQRWGARTIDLDLLFYGKQTIRHSRLTVPHPEIKNREFIQKALQELSVQN